MIIRPVVVATILGTLVATASAHDPNPKQMEGSFAAIARRAMPASVAIRTYEMISKPNDQVTVSKAMSHGSGFFVRADGHILTNAHVVEGADRVVVILGDGTFLDADVAGRDYLADLALLKVDAGRPMPVIPISEPGKVKPGMWAFAVGNPKGIAMSSGRLSFTVGTISGLNRDMAGRLESENRFYGNMIEADLSIWPGSSGGPMLNSDGEATGVVSAMASHGEECDEGPGAVAYAIPLEGHALRSLNTMLAGKPVRYSRIGVAISELDPATRSRMHLRRVRGVLVTAVPDGLPADKAGVAAGDIIVSFGGVAVKSTSELIRAVIVTKPGSIVLIGLLRKGKALTLQVVPTFR